MEYAFFEEFNEDIHRLGNNHHYGFLTETFEERGNELLKRSNNFLRMNENIDSEIKMKIKCLQFWLVGFLGGQKIKVYEENKIWFI